MSGKRCHCNVYESEPLQAGNGIFQKKPLFEGSERGIRGYGENRYNPENRYNTKKIVTKPV